MAKLTLSLIDSARGLPINNVEADVQGAIGGTWRLVDQLVSDDLGNVTIIRDDDTDDSTGYYEVNSSIGANFLRNGYVLPTFKFVDLLPVRFGIDDIFKNCRIRHPVWV